MLVNRMLNRVLYGCIAMTSLVHMASAQGDDPKLDTPKASLTPELVVEYLMDEPQDRVFGWSDFLGVSEGVWDEDARIAAIPTPTATCRACDKLAMRLSELEDRRLSGLQQMDALFQKIGSTVKAMEARGDGIRLSGVDQAAARRYVPSAIVDYGFSSDEELRKLAEELVKLIEEQDALAQSFLSLQKAAAETLRRFNACEKYYCPISSSREVAFLKGLSAGDTYWEAEQANSYTGLNVHSAFAVRDDLTDDLSLPGVAPPAPVPIPDPVPDPTPDPTPDPDPDPDPAPAPDPDPVPDPDPIPGLLVVSGPRTIGEVHEVGGDICPQSLGTVTLRNDGETALTFNITGVADWMSINSGPGGSNVSGTLLPGESRNFVVDFVCDFFGAFPTAGNPTDVMTTLAIDTSTPGATAGSSVSISLRVQDEE